MKSTSKKSWRFWNSVAWTAGIIISVCLFVESQNKRREDRQVQADIENAMFTVVYEDDN
jgi:type II secretory pathway component PulL